jgi:hypothetical protein
LVEESKERAYEVDSPAVGESEVELSRVMMRRRESVVIEGDVVE